MVNQLPAILADHDGDSRQQTTGTFGTKDQTFCNDETDPLDLCRKPIDLGHSQSQHNGKAREPLQPP
jgi:hypothetical protein